MWLGWTINLVAAGSEIWCLQNWTTVTEETQGAKENKREGRAIWEEEVSVSEKPLWIAAKADAGAALERAGASADAALARHSLVCPSIVFLWMQPTWCFKQHASLYKALQANQTQVCSPLAWIASKAGSQSDSNKTYIRYCLACLVLFQYAVEFSLLVLLISIKNTGTSILGISTNIYARHI